MNERRRMIMRAIFGHIAALPQKEIKEAVILVSYTEDHAFAFQKITGKDRPYTDRYPYLCSLDDGIKLIDPTISLLRPQNNWNFITMHYLMTFVQKAKFIFVFNASETQEMPFQNIKLTLTRFAALLKLDNQAFAALADSCGILITDAKPSPSLYSERLGGNNYNQNLLDKDYLTKDYEGLRNLVRGVLEKKKIMTCDGNLREIITEQFISFVKQLNYFDLSGRVALELKSAYQQYIQLNIHTLWDDVCKSIYNNLDLLLVSSEQQKAQQAKIVELVRDYDFQRRKMQDQRKQEGKQEFRSIKLLKVLNSMLQLIMKFINNQIADLYDPESNRQALTEFLNILYEGGAIKHPFIRNFLLSYFPISKCLSKQGAERNNEKDLFPTVSFCDIIRNVDIFHPKMREMSVALLRELENDLSINNKAFPVAECMTLLNSILQFKDVREFSFFTDRVTKKLLKCRATIAYNLVKQSQKNKKQHLCNELSFLKWSAESRLIKDKLKIEILIDIALSIAQYPHLIPLALQILDMLPEYEVFKHVRFIYEKQLKLNVQILQYLPEEQRKQLLRTHFQGYYTFFLKIGFQETVREMSMECLRLSDSQEDREFFKNALVKARGIGFRDLHNSFLQSSILQEKEVAVSQEFIQHVENEMKANEII